MQSDINGTLQGFYLCLKRLDALDYTGIISLHNL